MNNIEKIYKKEHKNINKPSSLQTNRRLGTMEKRGTKQNRKRKNDATLSNMQIRDFTPICF